MDRNVTMIELNWDKLTTSDPVRLADYVEIAIALDTARTGCEFTEADFIEAIQDQPYDPTKGFIEGDDVDEEVAHFEDALALMQRRRLWLGDLYPFDVKAKDAWFSPSTDRDIWMPYLFLLTCSHDELITLPDFRSESQFEHICKEAMKAFFNESADVFLFSQFSDDRQNIGRSAREALQVLAEKFNTRLIVEKSEIPCSANEFGVDIAAIDAMDDCLAVPFFAFAQCTITRNPQRWATKKVEARFDHGLAAYLGQAPRHSNFFFVPYFPRIERDKWRLRRHQISDCVFGDRFRICKALQRLRSFKDPFATQGADELLKEFDGRFGTKIPRTS